MMNIVCFQSWVVEAYLFLKGYWFWVHLSLTDLSDILPMTFNKNLQIHWIHLIYSKRTYIYETWRLLSRQMSLMYGELLCALFAIIAMVCVDHENIAVPLPHYKVSILISTLNHLEIQLIKANISLKLTVVDNKLYTLPSRWRRNENTTFIY